jgi:hypothetical protein
LEMAVGRSQEGVLPNSRPTSSSNQRTYGVFVMNKLACAGTTGQVSLGISSPQPLWFAQPLCAHQATTHTNPIRERRRTRPRQPTHTRRIRLLHSQTKLGSLLNSLKRFIFYHSCITLAGASFVGTLFVGSIGHGQMVGACTFDCLAGFSGLVRHIRC